MGWKLNKNNSKFANKVMLKSDHCGMETKRYVLYRREDILLKSDHSGMETRIRRLQ